MLYIDDSQNIKLTRGDSASFDLTVKQGTSTYDYSSDLAQFTVKRNTVTEQIVFQKTFNNGSIDINPSDTKDLNYKDLVYDVQIITPLGKVYTVIGPCIFEIMEEVNFNVNYS